MRQRRLLWRKAGKFFRALSLRSSIRTPKYGGVVPELASREHLRAIVPVVREALEAGQHSARRFSAIAVTSGPGLVGSLLVGVTYAKALCFARQFR